MSKIETEIKSQFNELFKQSNMQRYVNVVKTLPDVNAAIRDCERLFSCGFLVGYNRAKEGIIYDPADVSREKETVRAQGVTYQTGQAIKVFFSSGISAGANSALTLKVAPEEIHQYSVKPMRFVVDKSLTAASQTAAKSAEAARRIAPPYYRFEYRSKVHYDLTDISSKPREVLNDSLLSYFSRAYKKAEEKIQEATGKITDRNRFSSLLADQSWNKKFVNAYLYKAFVNSLIINILQYPYNDRNRMKLEKQAEQLRLVYSELEKDLRSRGCGSDIIEFHKSLAGACDGRDFLASHESEILRQHVEQQSERSYESGISRFEMFVDSNMFGSM
ncbi:hypothetical protein ACFPVX_05545 [Cohnella faecalis]|uniref:Uncharacterized protein n=1 Tax=Cohnella faecalis TaxID=2315694 RepID=A0A398CGK5_9BACL|nr:hypothetical protein [Cohnella faecalis]RIE00209.1 hypothetical protein D3H35_29685 [Cohnella faecalis]